MCEGMWICDDESLHCCLDLKHVQISNTIFSCKCFSLGLRCL